MVKLVFSVPWIVNYFSPNALLNLQWMGFHSVQDTGITVSATITHYLLIVFFCYIKTYLNMNAKSFWPPEDDRSGAPSPSVEPSRGCLSTPDHSSFESTSGGSRSVSSDQTNPSTNPSLTPVLCAESVVYRIYPHQLQTLLEGKLFSDVYFTQSAPLLQVFLNNLNHCQERYDREIFAIVCIVVCFLRLNAIGLLYIILLGISFLVSRRNMRSVFVGWSVLLPLVMVAQMTSLAGILPDWSYPYALGNNTTVIAQTILQWVYLPPILNLTSGPVNVNPLVPDSWYQPCVLFGDFLLLLLANIYIFDVKKTKLAIALSERRWAHLRSSSVMFPYIFLQSVSIFSSRSAISCNVRCTTTHASTTT